MRTSEPLCFFINEQNCDKFFQMRFLHNNMKFKNIHHYRFNSDSLYAVFSLVSRYEFRKLLHEIM